MAWICPHCAQPEDRHFYLGKDASGAPQIECLFDNHGLIDPSRYARLYQIVRDWNRIVRHLPSQLFVPRSDLEHLTGELDKLRTEHRSQLEELMETAGALEREVGKLETGKTAELASLREEHRQRIEALSAELEHARKGATTAAAITSLERKIGELQKENARLNEKLEALLSDETLRARIERVAKEQKEKILNSSDPGTRKALEARVAELEQENAELKTNVGGKADLIELNRELERQKTSLEERVAELGAELADARKTAPVPAPVAPAVAPTAADTIRVVFGRCATCGEAALHEFASTMPDGTVERTGACNNPKHLQSAVLTATLKASKKKSDKTRDRAAGAVDA